MKSAGVEILFLDQEGIVSECSYSLCYFDPLTESGRGLTPKSQGQIEHCF